MRRSITFLGVLCVALLLVGTRFLVDPADAGPHTRGDPSAGSSPSAATASPPPPPRREAEATPAKTPASVPPHDPAPGNEVLNGIVVDATGAPVGGALVALGDPEKDWVFRSEQSLGTRLFPEILAGTPGAAEFRTQRSDEDGGFAFPDLAMGTTCTLAAYHPDKGLVSVFGIPIGEQGERPVELSFPAGIALFGSVLDEDARPVAGGTVTLQPLREEGGRKNMCPLLTVVTDAQGSFRAPPLPYQEFVVDVNAYGFLSGTVGPLLATHPQHRVDVMLTRAPLIEGDLLLPDGSPAWLSPELFPFLTLMHTSGDPSRWSTVRTLVGKQGHVDREACAFSVPLHRPGGHLVLVEGDRMLGFTAVGDPADRHQIVVEVVPELARAVTLALKVLAADTGQLLTGARVESQLLGGPCWAQPSVWRESSGCYEFEELDAGTYRVWAEADGYAPACIEVVVGEHRSPLRRTFELRRGTHVLAGLVQRWDSQGVADCRVELRTQDGTPALPAGRTTRTDGAGRFSFPGLAEGEFVAVARPPVDSGLAPMALRLRVPADTATATLVVEAGVDVELILDAGPGPIPSPFCIQVLDSSGVPLYDDPSDGMRRYGSGTNLVLRPGAYTLVVVAESVRFEAIPFTAALGARIPVPVPR